MADPSDSSIPSSASDPAKQKILCPSMINPNIIWHKPQTDSRTCNNNAFIKQQAKDDEANQLYTAV